MTQDFPIPPQPAEPRSWTSSLWRGFRHRCPRCGEGALFEAFLKVAPHCAHCGEELHHQRADDAPPYFTMFIVGHIVVPLVLLAEKFWHPALWVHFSVWPLLTLALSFALMPAVKGAIVGLQWALRMHGFDYAARIQGE
jgi:uncharacterized protein (DUF983 family)